MSISRLPSLLEQDRPLVMGILNITPDSFSDGGQFMALDSAFAHALRMVDEGADIIDVGGESTRPGATAVTPEEEIARVLPTLHRIRQASNVALSVDTSKPEVIQAVVAADIDLINDVRALRADGALEAASTACTTYGLSVCLMHMQGQPRTMQENPHYADLLLEVTTFFAERIAACTASGIPRNAIILDPGFGFGKTPTHNLKLINQLHHFESFGLPLLVGLSRKSTIGNIAQDLSSGSLAGALIAADKGAKILRVHDVAATVSALNVWRSVSRERISSNA